MRLGFVCLSNQMSVAVRMIGDVNRPIEQRLNYRHA